MANVARRGSDSTPIAERHGRTGQVTLSVGVDPQVKDDLVAIAETYGWPLKTVVELALRSYIDSQSPHGVLVFPTATVSVASKEVS